MCDGMKLQKSLGIGTFSSANHINKYVFYLNPFAFQYIQVISGNRLLYIICIFLDFSLQGLISWHQESNHFPTTLPSKDWQRKTAFSGETHRFGYIIVVLHEIILRCILMPAQALLFCWCWLSVGKSFWTCFECSWSMCHEPIKDLLARAFPQRFLVELMNLDRIEDAARASTQRETSVSLLVDWIKIWHVQVAFQNVLAEKTCFPWKLTTFLPFKWSVRWRKPTRVFGQLYGRSVTGSATGARSERGKPARWAGTAGGFVKEIIMGRC